MLNIFKPYFSKPIYNLSASDFNVTATVNGRTIEWPVLAYDQSA
ncbi:hypothetical protein [Ureibacillus thermophilus]|nr:hypothetical protein [Ureibacillus thermophilus]